MLMVGGKSWLERDKKKHGEKDLMLEGREL